ncbi:MAG TPA: peptidylprolyl isomerase [Caulobacteraceae bacterium]|jgi:peptidyl-prolyl cis-trans isomerase C|nr:peptidylprolyl isomerase [Caulobacteraceae bacterium]
MIAAATLALLALAACGRQGPQGRPPEPGDAAVATLNGQAIWASDVRHEAVVQGVIGEGETLDPSSELFRRMLDEVVDQKLLAAEALRRDVQGDPAVRRRLDAARERILGDMLVQKVVEQAVNEGAIRGLYAQQRKLAKPADEFHARQIVVASQADAEAIRKLLSSGGSFEALADRRSIDAATRFNGGDLGYFTPDVMPDPYAAALKTARAGDIVGPFRSDAGWVLLKVEDRRPGQPISLEAARPQIVRFLTYDEVRDLLQKLRAKAKVTVLTSQASTSSTPARSDPPSSNPPSKKKP